MNMAHVLIREDSDPDMHIAIVVDLRCPKCTENFTVKIVEGFVASTVKKGLTLADWSVVRKHAIACFDAEHKCWMNSLPPGHTDLMVSPENI